MKTMIEIATPCHQWNFDSSSIFAQVDAFTQRCSDLLQVCQGRTQFALKTSTNKPQHTVDYPVFGGTRGDIIANDLLNIEVEFHKRIGKLRELNYSILDVKATLLLSPSVLHLSSL